MLSVETNGQSSKEDSCSFSHEFATGNSGGVHRRQGQSSSPAPNSKAKTDGEGEKPSKDSRNRDENSSDKRGTIPCRYRNCNNPSCSSWHPPVCLNYKFETGCTFGNKCFFRLKESIQLNCVCLKTERRNIGIKTSRQIIIQKCVPHERSLCAPEFEERSQEETLHQERCARGVAWELAKNF